VPLNPTAPRAFPLGSDFAGVLSVDYALSTATGRRALANQILRRLTTPRGGLIGAPKYGYDLLSVIGSTVPPSAVEQRVLEQVLEEEEVEDASCSVSFDNGRLTTDIAVVDGDGPFDLTIVASELTVQALIDGVEIFQEAA